MFRKRSLEIAANLLWHFHMTAKSVQQGFMLCRCNRLLGKKKKLDSCTAVLQSSSPKDFSKDSLPSNEKLPIFCVLNPCVLFLHCEATRYKRPTFQIVNENNASSDELHWHIGKRDPFEKPSIHRSAPQPSPLADHFTSWDAWQAGDSPMNTQRKYYASWISPFHGGLSSRLSKCKAQGRRLEHLRCAAKGRKMCLVIGCLLMYINLAGPFMWMFATNKDLPKQSSATSRQRV